MFHEFSGAVVRKAKARGLWRLVYFLDDFWGYADSKAEAMRQLEVFIELLAELGISVKWEKLILPTQVALFLGIVIDITNMVLSLERRKLDKYVRLMEELCGASHTTVQGVLRKLAGQLNHVCVVIPACKPWMRQLLAALGGRERSSGERVVVSDAMRDDWKFIMGVLVEQHNGRTIQASMKRWRAGRLETDACTSVGLGWCWLENGWCHKGRWSPAQAAWHINVMELFAVVHAARTCRHLWHGAVVPVQVDNTVCEGWLKKLGARSDEATGLLKELALLLLEVDACLEVFWVSTHDNKRPDALSRFDMVVFHEWWSMVSGLRVTWV